MKYISPIEIVAFTDDGVHSMAMEAGVPIELPDHMIPSLVAQGARPYVAPVGVSGSVSGAGLEDPVEPETPAPAEAAAPVETPAPAEAAAPVETPAEVAKPVKGKAKTEAAEPATGTEA